MIAHRRYAEPRFTMWVWLAVKFPDVYKRQDPALIARDVAEAARGRFRRVARFDEDEEVELREQSVFREAAPYVFRQFRDVGGADDEVRL